MSILLKECSNRKDSSTQTAIVLCNKIRDYSNLKLLCKTEKPPVSVYLEDFILELECKNKEHHVECIKVVEENKINNETEEETSDNLSTTLDDLPSIIGQPKKCEKIEKK